MGNIWKLMFVSLFTFLLFYSCSESDSPTEIEKPDETPALLMASIDSMVKTVSVLTGEIPVIVNGEQKYICERMYNDEGNGLAADYLTGRLRSFGLDVDFHYFSHNNDQFETSEGKNIIATQNGRQTDVFYMICAHYDSFSMYDTLAPGADDNASGVGVVVETARLLSQTETEYSIMYCLFDEEELGFVGSRAFADSIQNSMDIRSVINLDMVGWDGNNDGKVEFSHPQRESCRVLTQLADSINIADTLNLEIMIRLPGVLSDEGPFSSLGYTTLGISEYWGSDDRYPHYHKSTDKIEYFNLDYYRRIGTLAIRMIKVLAR